MNKFKIETVLKEKTLGLFSEQWYKNTSSSINSLFYNDNKLDYANNELFYKKCDNSFYAAIKYYNDDIIQIFKEFNYSPKKIKMLIQKWATYNDYFFNSGNSNGKRYFYFIK
jgi:hypothetical protein